MVVEVLDTGSILKLRVPGFKDDPKDQTMAIAATWASLPNLGGLYDYNNQLLLRINRVNCWASEGIAA